MLDRSVLHVGGAERHYEVGRNGPAYRSFLQVPGFRLATPCVSPSMSQSLLLSAKLLTGRDGAHKRIADLYAKGQPLPEGVELPKKRPAHRAGDLNEIR